MLRQRNGWKTDMTKSRKLYESGKCDKSWWLIPVIRTRRRRRGEQLNNMTQQHDSAHPAQSWPAASLFTVSFTCLHLIIQTCSILFLFVFNAFIVFSKWNVFSLFALLLCFVFKPQQQTAKASSYKQKMFMSFFANMFCCRLLKNWISNSQQQILVTLSGWKISKSFHMHFQTRNNYVTLCLKTDWESQKSSVWVKTVSHVQPWRKHNTFWAIFGRTDVSFNIREETESDLSRRWGGQWSRHVSQDRLNCLSLCLSVCDSCWFWFCS